MKAHPGRVHLIDGFPRNLENAAAWSSTGANPALVLNLLLKEDEMEKRILSRGQNRSDDNSATIQKRFKVSDSVSADPPDKSPRKLSICITA